MTAINKITFNIDDKKFNFEHTYPITINEHIESSNPLNRLTCQYE
jgi:hypothetical protein